MPYNLQNEQGEGAHVETYLQYYEHFENHWRARFLAARVKHLDFIKDLQNALGPTHQNQIIEMPGLSKRFPANIANSQVAGGNLIFPRPPPEENAQGEFFLISQDMRDFTLQNYSARDKKVGPERPVRAKITKLKDGFVELQNGGGLLPVRTSDPELFLAGPGFYFSKPEDRFFVSSQAMGSFGKLWEKILRDNNVPLTLIGEDMDKARFFGGEAHCVSNTIRNPIIK